MLLAPLVLALMVTAGPPPLPPAPKGDPLARLVWKLGNLSRLGRLTPQDLLYGCSDVKACAGDCAADLTVAGDGRGEGGRPRCRLLRGPGGAKELADRALGFVRERLRRAPHARPRGLDRDRMACGLGRLGLGPARPDSCERAEADALLSALPGVAEIPDEGPRTRALAQLCLELEGCTQTCGGALGWLVDADWSSLGDRVPTGPSCPELAKAMAAAGNDPAAIGTWIRARARDFATRACRRLETGRRADLACAAASAGISAGPPCAASASACPTPARAR